MASNLSEDEEKRPMRSIRSEKFALVTFHKLTRRKIDVFWMNYRGERVRYTILAGEKGEQWPIMTYETHPWIFRDSVTGEKISAIVDGERRDVFFPDPWKGEERQTVIYLDIPVYTLRDICLQEVKKIKTMDEINKLYSEMEIPKVLKDDLQRKEEIPFNERVSVPSL